MILLTARATVLVEEIIAMFERKSRIRTADARS
jgi:hypothetical protein